MAENKNGSITHIEEAEVIPSADKFNNVSDIGDKVIEIDETTSYADKVIDVSDIGDKVIEIDETTSSTDKVIDVSDIGDKVIEISESIFCPNCGKKYYKPTSVYCCYCGGKRI